MRAALALLGVACVAGCSAPPPQQPSTYTERIILLPNQDGRPSGLVVTRASGEQQLTTPYEAVELVGGAERRIALSDTEVRQRYGEMLAAQPARPLSFTFFFNLGTTDLTPQSIGRAKEVQSRIASFPAPQVTVIGHTDTTGAPDVNDALSLKRALAVRQYLIDLGVAANSIDAVGRGSRELLVPTPPGVSEERNRRVEVRLR